MILAISRSLSAREPIFFHLLLYLNKFWKPWVSLFPCVENVSNTRTHSKELLWQSLPELSWLSSTIQRPNVHLLIISLFYCFFIKFSINICIWYSEFTHLQTDLIIKTLQKWIICIGVIVQRPESLLLFVWSCHYPFYFHPLTLFYSGCWLIQMTQIGPYPLLRFVKGKSPHRYWKS